MYFTGMKNCLLLIPLLFCVMCGLAQPSTSTTTRDSYITFKETETEAAFPGGAPGWQQFLVQNIRFDKILPLVPRTGLKWQETAVVQFIVEKDGSVSQIKVVNEVSEAVASEAIRIISHSPKWIPATQNGKKVRAYKKQPIMFVVEPQ